MSTNRDQHAASIVMHKLRQNWNWSKTHRWMHLIEEHDLNPVIRGQRALRKAWWRLTKRDRRAVATPVFILGVQRSGTNMLAHGLDEVPEFEVYNEGNPKAFHNFRLCPVEIIESLIARSRADFVLFKPLCDSHRALELLDRFGPKARVIWAYRDVDGRVRSAVAKFGESNLRILRAYAAGEAQGAWQVQSLSPENMDFIRSFDFSRLSAESAAALFWYIRNSLYFEMALDRRPDAILAPYNLLLAEPERVADALCAFLGLGYRGQMIAHIDARRRPDRQPLPIDDRIRGRCTRLQERLDEAAMSQMSALISARSVPRSDLPRPTPAVAKVP